MRKRKTIDLANLESITLTCGALQVAFRPVLLIFEDSSSADIFGKKNNKTLAQTLAHRRYANLKDETSARYADALDMPLGTFLLGLKARGEGFYLRFLNPHGIKRYSRFRLADPRDFSKMGVYAYLVDGALTYIGRCRDSMKKRINQGYGTIHPKNCYRDGQSTNCHLNALITSAKGQVTLWLHELSDPEQIEILELALIQEHRPPWNVQIN